MHGHISPSVFAYDAMQPKGTNHVMDSDTQPHDREFENEDWYTPQCRTLEPQAPHQITDLETRTPKSKDMSAETEDCPVALYPRSF